MTLSLLARHVRHISLEADVPAFTFSNLSERLPVFLSDVKNFFATTLSLGETRIQPAVGTNKLASGILATPYAKLMNSKVFVSPGQSGTYIEVATALSHCQLNAGQLLDSVIYPFNKWVVQQLSEPSRMASFSNGHITNFKPLNNEGVMKQLDNNFKGRENTTELTFGDVFKRSSDYEAAANTLGNVQANFAKVPVAKVREAVETLTNNLERLVSRMAADPETYKPNGPTVKALAATTLDVAKSCTFYSVYAYKLQSVIKAFNDSEATILKHIEDIK